MIIGHGGVVWGEKHGVVVWGGKHGNLFPWSDWMDLDMRVSECLSEGGGRVFGVSTKQVIKKTSPKSLNI
jgi:hypothetical protein